MATRKSPRTSKSAAATTAAAAPRRIAARKAKPTARGANRDRKKPVDVGRALIEAFLTNERVNQALLRMIEPSIWDRSPGCSQRRNIATSFAHVHNVRCMRLKMCGAVPPERLERSGVTIEQARAALTASAEAMVQLIERALDDGGHVPDYRPDVVAFVCVAIAHEAHHRGQICHWARELGMPIGPEHQLRLWEWHKHWQEVVAG